MNRVKQSTKLDLERIVFIGRTFEEYLDMFKKNYIWDYFKDIEGLKKHRLSALKDCVKDMRKSNGRYVPVTLPTLPFKNGEFDIVLSAHFLFMYADRLDYHFHISTLNELLRVTKKEIRIYPLVDLEGKRYEHLDKIISYLIENACTVEEIKVPYEFQENANSMLKIKKE
ncbi:class I SAM-dependent methyltransferase [Chengkuizengella sediminis]|uniref:class I SAM-dependent methyltransferase n=1 Tax=Chengkuizengella sediminis TaxID=1885917 RepID=UPI001389EBD0|nr:class I SAM-dependent methyltransferase [Chengkuizengella sediminis]NDI35020.1 class I SAM-dependent methyltransferase [Chengkuizengella sediminis]